MATTVSNPLSLSPSATSVALQDEPTVRFTNVKKLFQAINSVSGNFLVVTSM